MASMNQTRPHCVNQMGKTHSKPLAARYGRGTAWAQHGHGMLCVYRPYVMPFTAPIYTELVSSRRDSMDIFYTKFHLGPSGTVQILGTNSFAPSSEV